MSDSLALSALRLSSFFSSSVSSPFSVFSPAHLVSLGAFLLAAALLLIFRRAIRAKPKRTLILRLTLLALLAAAEASLHIWYIARGVWNARFTLPLELCSLMLLAAILMLLTRSRFLAGLVFFAGIGGALQALITPNLAYAYPHFRFVQFFVAHAAIILSALYMVWIERFRPTWHTILSAMLSLNALALVVYLLDRLLDANYMFLRGKPDTPSVLDMLGDYPLYIVAEELLALFTFTTLYILFFLLPDALGRGRSGGKSKTE
ncbi:TIGR02206 family membrane protein [Saccharibacillus sp. CPCC 101409]|uniref:YwaF family protein n=1 Tax=Saccharibacillus sp. CPCC 101409 TaxID=3058041 RepID=UPI002673822A|nr:TIGR02206 family membrane protein [Saccharibacillus sp. CPCC 101409]MDO3409076.1 TIGR02206 family membrane protein [Saccharibacillus sp. CPCC 101409]